MQKINSIEELKQLASNKTVEGFILLNYNLKSSKSISYDVEKKLFHVFNYIDDTENDLTEEELKTESNIAEAIEKGAFFIDE